MNSQQLSDSNVTISPIELFELKFENLTVMATVEEEVEVEPNKFKKMDVEKCILNDCSGMFSPNTFTAIVGPSGCGKTTLLNLLSARLLANNLKLSGKLFVNQQQVYDINVHGDKIGYVMQEDLLFPTFTPRECFQFIANMRLVQLTPQERHQRVEEIISVLGLTKCADTYVGNALIRGVSGGEKKRTSIGVELLINPSIIFLDEPTTGLDSTTALNVISFLNKMAKAGRTIVSTIHQPSSQIFAEFDRLVIMVQGNIVYQGSSKTSPHYFKELGFPIALNSNPTDFYMKIMNKEGIALKYIEENKQYTDEQVLKEFEERVNFFITKYKEQNLSFAPVIANPLGQSDSQGYLPFCGQFGHIFVRAVKNELRNPLDVRLRLVQQIFQGLICIILYYKAANDSFSYIQNTTGCIFFFTTVNVFGGVFANIASFNSQRSIFVRQRMNNTYTTSAYFWGKSTATFPVEILAPLLFLAVAYFACNLNNETYVFFWALLISELIYFCSASYALVISTLISDLNVATALTPLTIIPLMLVAGFFNNLTQVPKIFYPLEYISMFKYGFQALVQNQYRYKIDCGPMVGQCDILTYKYNFPEEFWLNLVLLAVIGIFYRCVALLVMQLVSTPKRVHLEKTGEPQPPVLSKSQEVAISSLD